MLDNKITKNNFYDDFDFETWGQREEDERTTFQRDRDRIIHSFSFRRLQAKTQLFLSGEYDFYRTRLTHSMEVAQIGRSICNHLIRQGDFHPDFYVDHALVEAICLSHDLGNSPFGHSGERHINNLMMDFGGFEGNAQTLRLVTELFYSGNDSKGSREGMQPTRGFVDGLLKYKTIFKESARKEKHFIYDAQEKIRNWVFNGSEIPKELMIGEKLNSFKSIECQIMDWSDEIAYALSDFADGISAGFITHNKVKEWLLQNKQFQDYQKDLMEVLDISDPAYGLSRKIGKCIEACGIEERNNFMSDTSNRYKYKLTIAENRKYEIEMFKKLSLNLVFESSKVCQLEFKANAILKFLFNSFHDHYIKDKKDKRIVPESIHTRIMNQTTEQEETRTICDHISGMTDFYAIRTYKRMFDPDFGSIVDLV